MSEITLLTLVTSIGFASAMALYLSEQRINSDSEQLTLADLIYMIFSSKPNGTI